MYFRKLRENAYFRYFLPMSCGTTLGDATIFSAASGHQTGDYFVFIMTGTQDFAYSYENNRNQEGSGKTEYQ